MNIIKNDIELLNFEFNNFYEKSRKLIFNNYKSHLKFPIAILTGGQPGAGKGGLVIKAKNDFAKFDIIPIILMVIGIVYYIQMQKKYLLIIRKNMQKLQMLQRVKLWKI